MESLEALACITGSIAGAVLWGEVVHFPASKALTSPERGGKAVVVVFGYRNSNPTRANALNRWRVRVALRSLEKDGSTQTIVFCGGGPSTRGASEAALMAAAYARASGFAGIALLDEGSTSTWQNVENAIPLIEGAHRIKFVSNPLHAQKVRLYLNYQRPDLATRLVRAADYRFGEWAFLKPLFAAYGLFDLVKARRSLKTSQCQ